MTKGTIVHATMSAEAAALARLLCRVLDITMSELVAKALESEVRALSEVPAYRAAFEHLRTVDQMGAEAKRNRRASAASSPERGGKASRRGAS